MKKFITIIMLCAVFGVTACKKDWTCTCKDSSGATTDVHAILHESNSQAKTTCTSMANTGQTCSI